MSKYLFDTGVLIRYFRGDIRAVQSLQECNGKRGISVLTITELLVGCNTPKKRNITKKHINTYDLFAITTQIAEVASELVKQYPEYFGKKIHRGIIDAFIAATAIEHDLTLVTLNRKHFEKLKYGGFRCIILKESNMVWNLIQ